MDSSLRKTYQTDGVIRIKGALDAHALKQAEAAYGASPIPVVAPRPSRKKPGTFYQDLANPKALSAYRETLLETPVADIVADLWDAPNVWFMYEQVFLKEGGESRRTPWHQDASYLPVEGSQLAVMWISFEPVAEETSWSLCADRIAARSTPGPDSIRRTIPRLSMVTGCFAASQYRGRARQMGHRFVGGRARRHFGFSYCDAAWRRADP